MKRKILFFVACSLCLWATDVFAQPVNSIAFNGTDQYMRIGHHSDFNISTTEDFTVSFWVKATSYVMGKRYLSKRDLDDNTLTNRAGYEFWSGNLTTQCWAINTPKSDAGNILSAYSGSSVATSTWFHVAMVVNRNTGEIYMYQNGTREQSSTNDMSAWAVTNTFDVLVGAGVKSGVANNFMSGAIGNLRFYKRALSVTEISADMNTNNFTALSADLKNAAVGAYDFGAENINGLTVSDLSGKNHNGTLVNFPVETPSIVSVDLTQNTKFTGRTNAQDEIIRAAVVFGGTAKTVDLTSVKINLEGTTDVADIDAIKIYSTGATGSFDFRNAAGATLLGTVNNPATGDITCNLTGQLSSGTNYLWITASVSATATEGNKIDASLKEITTATETFTVANPSPTGSREILLARKLVFAPGDYGSTNYRIPVLRCLPNGNLLAITDKRKYNETDLPQDIDIVSRISTDNGLTWSAPVTIAQGQGINQGYGDAAITVAENGDIMCVFVGGYGLWTSTAATPISSYFCKSTDGGNSWTTPVNITSSLWGAGCGDVTRANFTSSFFGSGNGLTLKRTHKGRIMFVAAMTTYNGGNANTLYNYAVYSDDNGATWQVSNQASVGGDEAKVVELNDGTVVMSIRHAGTRWYNTSSDGGETWGTVRSWTDMQNTNACNGDVIRFTSTLDNDDKNRILHSLPDNTARKNVTVFVSYDEGTTWGVRKSICPYESVYSSLTILPDGTIGAYIEENPDGKCSLYFMNFSIKWLTNGADDYSPITVNLPTVELEKTGFVVVGKEFILIRSSEKEAKIYNSLGQLVLVKALSGETMVPLTKGIYFVQLGNRVEKTLVR